MFSEAVSAHDDKIQFVAVTAQKDAGSSFSYKGRSHAVKEDTHHEISAAFADAFGRLRTVSSKIQMNISLMNTHTHTHTYIHRTSSKARRIKRGDIPWPSRLLR